MACAIHTAACTCTFVAGENIEIVGDGPYNIYREPAANLATLDTASVDLTQAGLGTDDSPRVVRGETVIATLLSFASGATLFSVSGSGTALDPTVVSAWMSCMLCEDRDRADGKVLLLERDGNYHPHVVPVIAQGALTVGVGLAGDGSAQDPLSLELCNYDTLAAVCGTP